MNSSPTLPPSKLSRCRVDELLVARQLAASRTQAKALILAGQVRTGPDSVVSKPGQLLRSDTTLIVAQPPLFVSRGGEKLAGFLRQFPLAMAGIHALDVGASTGGFTDCLLQHGAASVTCVDVGRAQLHAKLRADPRVTNLEKINARHLGETALPRPIYELVVMDVSFISLTKVLPAVWARVSPGGHLIALVKPQFEATRAEATAGRGIIRDPAIHQRILKNIIKYSLTNLAGSVLHGELPSPLPGGDGNTEFLMGLLKKF